MLLLTRMRICGQNQLSGAAVIEIRVSLTSKYGFAVCDIYSYSSGLRILLDKEIIS